MVYDFLSKENILNQGIFNFSFIEELLDKNYSAKEKTIIKFGIF